MKPFGKIDHKGKLTNLQLEWEFLILIPVTVIDRTGSKITKKGYRRFEHN